MPTSTQPYPQRELIISPMSYPGDYLQAHKNQLLQVMNGIVEKITLDVNQIYSLNGTDLNEIAKLYQECDEREIEFEIRNTSKAVYKSLLYSSLEFLEITHRKESS